jgi:hypothetical protein
MRLVTTALVLGFVTACDRLPTPRIPQAEQAVQAAHGGGERLRAHQRCVEATNRVEDLVRCMDAEGYHFVARAPGFPASECWGDRDQPAEDALPPPHCFEHAPDATH